MEYLLYKYWDPINKNRFLYKDIAITKNLFSNKEVSKKLSMPTIGFLDADGNPSVRSFIRE